MPSAARVLASQLGSGSVAAVGVGASASIVSRGRGGGRIATSGLGLWVAVGLTARGSGAYSNRASCSSGCVAGGVSGAGSTRIVTFGSGGAAAGPRAPNGKNAEPIAVTMRPAATCRPKLVALCASRHRKPNDIIPASS